MPPLYSKLTMVLKEIQWELVSQLKLREAAQQSYVSVLNPSMHVSMFLYKQNSQPQPAGPTRA